MLKRLYVNNYKTLVNFEVKFTENNLFLGKNGSGKTSVLQIFDSLKMLITGHGRVSDLFSVSTKTKWMTLNVQTFEFECLIEELLYTYHLEIEFEEYTYNCRIKTEWVKCGDNFLINTEAGETQLYNDNYEPKTKIYVDWAYSAISIIQKRFENTKLIQFRNSLEKLIVCSPLPEKMNEIALHEQKIPDLNFSNVAEVYRFVTQEFPDSINDFLNELKQSLNGFTRLFLQGSESDAKKLMADFVIESNKKTSLDFLELSDGERKIISLYMLVFFYIKNGYSVFLDEADNYLSLTELQPFLSIVEENLSNGGQAILISHNSVVMDFYNPEHIQMFKKDDSGLTQVSPPKTTAPISVSELVLRGDNA